MRSLLALALLSTLAAPALAQEGGGAAPPSPSPEAPPAPEVVPPEVVPPEAVAPEAVAPAAAADAAPVVAAQPESVAIDPELFLESEESGIEDSDAPTEELWYGWQTLTADGASFVLVILAGATSDSGGEAGTFGGLSLATYLLGGPIIHFAHENVGRGFGSLALRGGLPILFGVVGVGLEDCSDGEFLCGLGGLVLGGLLGIVTAITVDASLLGYESVPVEESSLPKFGVVVGRKHGLIVTGGTF